MHDTTGGHREIDRTDAHPMTESTLEQNMAATQRQERTETGVNAAPRGELLLEGRARFEAEALVHLDAMYSFALKLSRSRDEAEDLVSDTILRAFEPFSGGVPV